LGFGNTTSAAARIAAWSAKDAVRLPFMVSSGPR
jgi:hypothetical protein